MLNHKRMNTVASDIHGVYVCVCVLATQSCPTLCDLMDCSPPGSSIYGILQSRILDWVAFPFSRGPSRTRCEPWSPTLQAYSLLNEPPRKPLLYSRTLFLIHLVYVKVKVLVAPSCPTPCNPMNCSPPGSSVHGTLQARILEWIAISFSRGSSRPRDPVLQADS